MTIATIPAALLEETLRRSIAGHSSLAKTLNSILAVVAAHPDADLREAVDAIMAARRQPERVDFADLPAGDAVH